MRIYLDDRRRAPPGWQRVTTVQEFIYWCTEHWSDLTQVSLDHDLGSGEPTGAAAVYWLLGRLTYGKYHPGIGILCHSDNPDGRVEIESAITKFQEDVRWPSQ